jgi:hypothetical protein
VGHDKTALVDIKTRQRRRLDGPTLFGQCLAHVTPDTRSRPALTIFDKAAGGDLGTGRACGRSERRRDTRRTVPVRLLEATNKMGRMIPSQFVVSDKENAGVNSLFEETQARGKMLRGKTLTQ